MVDATYSFALITNELRQSLSIFVVELTNNKR